MRVCEFLFITLYTYEKKEKQTEIFTPARIKKKKIESTVGKKEINILYT